MDTLEKFYDYLLAKRGFSDCTIEGYKKVLNKFIRESGSEKPKTEQAENWIVKLRKEKRSRYYV